MLRFVARRLLGTIPVLFGLSFIVFAFVHQLPGDPATTILGERARPDTVAALRVLLGLDEPIHVQYADYLAGLARGDIGTSFVNNKPVAQEFLTRFPATAELGLSAMAIGLLGGVFLGRVSARRDGGRLASAISLFTLFGVSLPIFVLGLGLAFVFGVVLHVLPTIGRLDSAIVVPTVTNSVVLDSLLDRNLPAFFDAIRHLALPAFTLSLYPMAVIARITRASYLEVSYQDYVRTAVAKGLDPRVVEHRHIMRNAWPPIITSAGVLSGSLLGGAVITETIFAWPGVGSWLYLAIINRDYFVIQGAILVNALIYILINFSVDVSYVYLNPRIRY